jgi:hypothetical protein
MKHLEVIELWNKSGRTFGQNVSKSHSFANTFSLVATALRAYSTTLATSMLRFSMYNIFFIITTLFAKKRKVYEEILLL